MIMGFLRKIRNKLLLLFVLSFLGGFISAQQDPQYSQYMFNGLVVNPAYAGSREALHINGLFRAQWLGIPGAPITQTFSLHAPTRNLRHGFGGTLVNDAISYLRQTWASFDYAYRIPSGKTGYFCLGLRATFHNYRINWAEADLKNPSDFVPVTYGNNFFLPNAGTGFYYYNKNLYAGISVPRLLINSLDQNRAGISLSENATDIPQLKRHYFAFAGYVIKIDDFIRLKPSFMIKYITGVTPEADLNLNAYFGKRFGVGASYRTLDGIVFMAEFWANPQLRLGYAYDYPFTKLNGFTSGSHELMISYDFQFGLSNVVSPRVF